MSSLATQMLHSDIEVPCPQCGYPIWVLWAEIVVQTAVRCPACRCQVWLHDAEGGIHNAAAELESAIRQATKGLSK